MRMRNGGAFASRGRLEIDKSIAQKAEVELLYDRPYEDTVESPRQRTFHRRKLVTPSGGACRRGLS